MNDELIMMSIIESIKNNGKYKYNSRGQLNGKNGR